jgi:hypothetical protein
MPERKFCVISARQMNLPTGWQKSYPQFPQAYPQVIGIKGFLLCGQKRCFPQTKNKPELFIRFS